MKENDLLDDSLWEFKPVRRSWATREHKVIHCYQSVEGRVPIPELIAALERDDVDWHKVTLNYATATWDDVPTDEEIAKQAERDEEATARHEKWEREALVRLTEKYGPPGDLVGQLMGDTAEDWIGQGLVAE